MRRVPPQSLTWRVDVEPYPAISYNGDGMTVTVEHWTYTAYDGGGGEPWQQIEHAGFGAGEGELRTFARWYALESLIADPDADPPAWLIDAIRAIEADS